MVPLNIWQPMKFTPLDARTQKTASQVVYQIFPERFAIGGGKTSAEKLQDPAYDLPGLVKHDWDRMEFSPPWSNHFCGGDLDGITDHLDYLVDLGITNVYLTPIFSAPSNHKYDSADFFKIDAMFGGEAALERLITALHARDMTLTLDAVLNHVSNTHPWFLAAQAGDPDKQDWFTLREDGSYECWQGHGTLPELNLSNLAVRDVMYRRSDSMVQHWLSQGVDHWRFDVAQDVGIAVASEMANIVGARFPQAGLLGELNGFSGSWFDGAQEGKPGYQGMMNYWYRTATLAWLAGEIDAVQLNGAVRDAREGYGLKGLLCSWNLLSSHDTPRLGTVVNDPVRAKLAWLMQCTLPGIPLIYYGEENGMLGGADPECRRPMTWNENQWNQEQRAWLKQLIAVRQASAALKYGDIIVLGDRLPGNALVFLRATGVPGEEALVIVNGSEAPLHVRLMLPYSHWYDGIPLKDALSNALDTQVQAGSVMLDIAPLCGAVYLPTNPYRNYNFFKPRNSGEVSVATIPPVRY